jgi:hypothetical protein
MPGNYPEENIQPTEHGESLKSIKLEFFPNIFKKYPNIKFHENLSSRSQAVLFRWMDRHDEANNCLSQSCKHSQQCTLKSGYYDSGIN